MRTGSLSATVKTCPANVQSVPTGNLQCSICLTVFRGTNHLPRHLNNFKDAKQQQWCDRALEEAHEQSAGAPPSLSTIDEIRQIHVLGVTHSPSLELSPSFVISSPVTLTALSSQLPTSNTKSLTSQHLPHRRTITRGEEFGTTCAACPGVPCPSSRSTESRWSAFNDTNREGESKLLDASVRIIITPSLADALKSASLSDLSVCPTNVQRTWDQANCLPPLMPAQKLNPTDKSHTEQGLFENCLRAARKYLQDVRIFMNGMEDGACSSDRKLDLLSTIAYRFDRPKNPNEDVSIGWDMVVEGLPFPSFTNGLQLRSLPRRTAGGDKDGSWKRN